MKTTILAVSLLLLIFVGVCNAKTLKIPTDKPAVQVTVPDSYKPDESDTGYTAESSDQDITFYFDVTTAKDLEGLVTENMKYLVKQKVNIDLSSKKEEDFKSNGFDVTKLSYDAKQEGYGDEKVTLFLIPLDDDTVFMITYWVTKKGEKAHEAEVSAIFNSIKKI